MKKAVHILLTLSLAFLFIFFAVETISRFIFKSADAVALRFVEINRGHGFKRTALWGTASLKQASPYDQVTSGEYVPGIHFRFRYASNPHGYFDAENSVESRINEFGTRGPSFPRDKGTNTFRILGLGDSFTFGEGVKQEDTFLALLRQRCVEIESSKDCEVINAGVSSYNTADEVIYLENKWVHFNPDLVIITFVINDAYSDAVFGPLHQGYVRELNQLADHPYIWGSRFIAWAYSRYLNVSAGRRTERIYHSQFSEEPLVAGHHWDDCKSSLQRAKELSDEHGFKLVLVIFPELLSLTNAYPFQRIHQLVETEGQGLGIPVLDLLDHFKGQKDSDLWVHPTDHHPNAVAHKLAADAILEFLVTGELSR